MYKLPSYTDRLRDGFLEAFENDIESLFNESCFDILKAGGKGHFKKNYQKNVTDSETVIEGDIYTTNKPRPKAKLNIKTNSHSAVIRMNFWPNEYPEIPIAVGEFIKKYDDLRQMYSLQQLRV